MRIENVTIDKYPVIDCFFENGDKANRRSLKLALIEKIGICYWCKCEVHDHPQKDGQKSPNNSASIDHLKSRPEGREKHEIVEKVLSCEKCNAKRGVVMNKLFNKKTI